MARLTPLRKAISVAAFSRFAFELARCCRRTWLLVRPSFLWEGGVTFGGAGTIEGPAAAGAAIVAEAGAASAAASRAACADVLSCVGAELRRRSAAADVPRERTLDKRTSWGVGRFAGGCGSPPLLSKTAEATCSSSCTSTDSVASICRLSVLGRNPRRMLLARGGGELVGLGGLRKPSADERRGRRLSAGRVLECAPCFRSPPVELTHARGGKAAGSEPSVGGPKEGCVSGRASPAVATAMAA
mmetsp:Transcript_31710/g.83034  ORF Transcript_31710/g.83034 Transcript_31710/m.83034 type:complete len:244 (+) Transcript_31710:2837-3568(+)